MTPKQPTNLGDFEAAQQYAEEFARRRLAQSVAFIGAWQGVLQREVDRALAIAKEHERRLIGTHCAALMTLNSGMTTSSISGRPPPSGPSRLASGMHTPSAVTGEESLTRSPSPSNFAATRRPSAEAGTSHKVQIPSAASSRLDQTYNAACDAEVMKLLRALSATPPLTLTALLTGAQNWLREPASENASVL